jgi:hypothetical protein
VVRLLGIGSGVALAWPMAKRAKPKTSVAAKSLVGR